MKKAEVYLAGEAMGQTVGQRFDEMLLFDARYLDAETRRELVRILPGILRSAKAWREEFDEYGCVSCHSRVALYAAGGFCDRCYHRIAARLKARVGKQTEGRDVDAEIAALTAQSDVARWLLADGPQPRVAFDAKESGPMLTYKTKRGEE
jgi:hypothetical protein